MRMLDQIRFISLLFLIYIYSVPIIYAQDSVIVKFRDDNPRHTILRRVMRVRPLIPSLGLYQVFTNQGLAARDLKTRMLQMPGVEYVSANHQISQRSKPNDKRFREQWAYLEDGVNINAFKAWDFGVGGKDFHNRKIVVAVIDSAFDIDHEDLKANMWKNTAEIPGNETDDDANGYVDDYDGWNAYEESADLRTSSWYAMHGTHIAGIIGAKGNNGLGVAGVNWNANILPIAGSGEDTATLLIAFNYVITQKKIWLDSKGRRGANIVVINSSFGVDGGDCESEDFKPWNDVFNAVGSLGIINVVAAPNDDIDVDEVGDVPTGCSSPYLIKVTSMDRSGEIDDFTAYGAESIDLAAPGVNILSTYPIDSYETSSGTSMAVPFVTGTVALLHSTASLDFQRLYQDQPSFAALELKRELLKSVTPSAHWQGLVASNGFLNIGASVQRMRGFKHKNPKRKGNYLDIIDDFAQFFDPFYR
jgi:hypothetical protein